MSQPAARLRHARYLAPLLLLALLAPAPAVTQAATTIYRTVDADGNPVFSDQPPPPGERAETLEIQQPSSFQAPAQPQDPASGADTWDWDMQSQDEESEVPFVYGGVAIVAPANDEGVRGNDGVLNVVAAVTPELRPGHQIEILLDGQVVASAADSAITVSEVERGTHTLEARIVDEAGTVLVASDPVTFHMLRYVPQLAPNRPKPSPRGN